MHFNHVTTFEAPYHSTFVNGGAHMQSVDIHTSYNVCMSTTLNRSPVQAPYSTLNMAMGLKHATESSSISTQDSHVLFSFSPQFSVVESGNIL